jgi:hypothetical protein
MASLKSAASRLFPWKLHRNIPNHTENIQIFLIQMISEWFQIHISGISRLWTFLATCGPVWTQHISTIFNSFQHPFPCSESGQGTQSRSWVDANQSSSWQKAEPFELSTSSISCISFSKRQGVSESVHGVGDIRNWKHSTESWIMFCSTGIIGPWCEIGGPGGHWWTLVDTGMPCTSREGSKPGKLAMERHRGLRSTTYREYTETRACAISRNAMRNAMRNGRMQF